MTSPAPVRVAQPADYQGRTEALAAVTAAQALAVLAAWRVGSIQRPELPMWLATTIRAGAARAVHMADRSISDELGATIGRPVPVVGLVLPDPKVKVITTGVQTSLLLPEGIEARIEQLARSAPLDAGQTARHQAMERQGVEGWTRKVDRKPCALCRALADGTVIPISKQMIRHPNCSCVAEPVLTGAAPKQRPDDGDDDPSEFVPRTLTTGRGIAGRQYTQVQPGLRITRSVFVPAARRTAR